MKKLLNDPSRVVREMFEGLVVLAPDTALLRDVNVVVRRVSGGGSGHESAHAGYVGEGLLAAAVCGEVFTSPSTADVLAAIRASAGPNGALLVVKNYTGDRLNFGLAAALARAEGIPVEVVVVADDVSLRDTVKRARRRGIAGTVFVHKIAVRGGRGGQDACASHGDRTRGRRCDRHDGRRARWVHVAHDAAIELQSRMGPGSYLGERAMGVPDGGAVAVACGLRALRPFVR